MPNVQRKIVVDTESLPLKEWEELTIYFDGEHSIYKLHGEERTRAIAEAIRVIVKSTINVVKASRIKDESQPNVWCPNLEYLRRVLLEMDAERANTPRLTQDDIDKAFIYAFDHKMIGPISIEHNSDD